MEDSLHTTSLAWFFLDQNIKTYKNIYLSFYPSIYLLTCWTVALNHIVKWIGDNKRPSSNKVGPGRSKARPAFSKVGPGREKAGPGHSKAGLGKKKQGQGVAK